MSDPKVVIPEVLPAEPEKPIMASVEWYGIKVSLPAFKHDLDPDAVEAFEQGKAITGLRGLMGSSQYDEIREQFREQHGRKPTVLEIAGDDNDKESQKASLASAVLGHYGFIDAGE